MLLSNKIITVFLDRTNVATSQYNKVKDIFSFYKHNFIFAVAFICNNFRKNIMKPSSTKCRQKNMNIA